MFFHEVNSFVKTIKEKNTHNDRKAKRNKLCNKTHVAFFLMCLCFSDQFRRRDTTQTGNASFQYDDVSFLQLTCFFFVWRVRFSAAFSCVKINTEFIILSLNAGGYLIWNLCRVCINRCDAVSLKGRQKTSPLTKTELLGWKQDSWTVVPNYTKRIRNEDSETRD